MLIYYLLLIIDNKFIYYVQYGGFGTDAVAVYGFQPNLAKKAIEMTNLRA